MVRFRARRGLAGRRCDPDFMGKAEGLPDLLKASELGRKAETGMLTRDSPVLESTGRSRWHARPGGRTPPARVLGDARRPARNRGGRQPIPGRLRLVRDRACVFLLAPGRLPVCDRARVSRRVAGSGCRLVQLGRARLFRRPPRVGGRTRSREPPPGRRSIWRILGDRHHRCPFLLYWTLQRWHRKLDWGPGSRSAALGWVGSLDRGLGFSIGDTLTDYGISI